MLRTTSQERLALGVAALLLAAGAGVRMLRPAEPVLWNGTSPADTSQTGAVAALRVAAAAQAADDERRARPLAEGELLDPNRVDALELERLPRVGPALARRMVAWRDSAGPFRSLADLDAVPGVGPAMLAQIAPHLALPAGGGTGGGGGAPGPLPLNRATPAELEALPGIGPALAARIVEWRERNGPFAAVDQLQEVPGIGPALLGRLAPHLRVPP